MEIVPITSSSSRAKRIFRQVVRPAGPEMVAVPSALRKFVDSGDKLIPVGNGGSVQIGIQLAEPIVFLHGCNANANQTPTVLRGTLYVRITKPTKVKAISLRFRGRAHTEWPEGIPPRKLENSEEKELVSHTWPFFNATFPESMNALLGVHQYPSAREPIPGSRGARDSPSASPVSLGPISAAALPKLGSSGSFDTASRGYKMFSPGTYRYDFEHAIPAHLPESIDVNLGGVKYELEAAVERAGAFKSKVTGTVEVTVVRVPGDNNTETYEPIGISRNWEDQLHYEIIISGKSFPIGSTIPIAFKLTPLAKVKCHRIKVFLTENIEYWCRKRKVHRVEPTRKVELLEKLPGAGESLLGKLEGNEHPSATEFEFMAKIPDCGASFKQRLHFDTTYDDIKVHHWIKVMMRLSKVDDTDQSKRRHFEISIDSPIHLVSCRATPANTNVPAYTLPSSPQMASSYPCPCVLRNAVPMTPAQTQKAAFASPFAGMGRPLHLLRQPSNNPPDFFEDVAPPLLTPPPQYDNVVNDDDEYFRSRGHSLDISR